MGKTMEFTQVFEVSYGIKNFDGEGNDELNGGRITVLANSATEAITKATAWFGKDEFLVGVKQICEVRIS